METVKIPGKIPPKKIEFIVERPLSRGNPLFFKAPTMSKRATDLGLLDYLKYTKKKRNYREKSANFFEREARDELYTEDVKIDENTISLLREIENRVANATKVHNMSGSRGDNLFNVSPFIIDSVIGQNWDIEFTHMFIKSDDPFKTGSHVYDIGFSLKCTNVITGEVKENNWGYPGPLCFRKLSNLKEATDRTNEDAETLLRAKREVVITMLKALMRLVPELFSFEDVDGKKKSTDLDDWVFWQGSDQYNFLWGLRPLNTLLSPVQAIVGSTGYTFTETRTKT